MSEYEIVIKTWTTLRTWSDINSKKIENKLKWMIMIGSHENLCALSSQCPFAPHFIYQFTKPKGS